MKTVFFYFFVIYSMCCLSQNTAILDSIFSDREFYCRRKVPPRFQEFYTGFLKSNETKKKQIIERINNLSDKSGEDTILLVESLDLIEGNITGFIWSKKDSISYKLNNLDTNLIIPYNLRCDRFIKEWIWDLKRWNSNVTNRSFLYSDIAGAPILLYTIMIGDDIKSTGFVGYSKKSLFNYYKEKPYNNYKTLIFKNEN